MAFLVIAISIIALVSFLIWWLFFESEGVYLGKKVVIWLYDLYANRYDKIKEFNEVHEHVLLAQPILHRIEPRTDPLVLDVATGTGRLPIALLSHLRFTGTIVGLDLSRKMLIRASEKLAILGYDDEFILIHQSAESLPFDDNRFDIVTCMESLEFMPDPKSVLSEAIRVLRPGGLLLITNRINTRWMPSRLWSEDQLTDILEQNAITEIEFEIWQQDYQKVWGIKSGNSSFIGAVNQVKLIQCPCCSKAMNHLSDGTWYCHHCSMNLSIGEDRILDYAFAKQHINEPN